MDTGAYHLHLLHRSAIEVLLLPLLVAACAVLLPCKIDAKEKEIITLSVAFSCLLTRLSCDGQWKRL